MTREYSIPKFDQLSGLIGWWGVANMALANGKSHTWNVEAAHIYTDEVPTISHDIGAHIGARLSQMLGGINIYPQNMLLIDNFHPSVHTLNVFDYLNRIEGHGFRPDTIVMEADLENAAYAQIIDPLKKAGKTTINKHGALVLPAPSKKGHEVVLETSPEKGKRASCAALDAALYLHKFDSAGMCVTVLDRKWISEQKKTRRVVHQILGKSPILDVYYSYDSEKKTIELEVDFDY